MKWTNKNREEEKKMKYEINVFIFVRNNNKKLNKIQRPLRTEDK